jgi:7-carboxy-7-deazaguanine synthase
MRTYLVKERFRTIQGEGFHTGTPALFIRLAGCNMWNGRDEDRERDAQRNRARCPAWCDTDFVGGDRMTAREVCDLPGGSRPVPLIVITGGEPLLQVDPELLCQLENAYPEAQVAIETNGTLRPEWFPLDGTASHFIWDQYDERRPSTGLLVRRPWITLSPKRGRAETLLPWADEIKLVTPDYSPAEWEDFPARHRYVQPRAHGVTRDEGNEHVAAMWVADNHRWKLSLQLHKVVRMP